MKLNYIPILKAKQGELEAISYIGDSYFEGIFPLLDIGTITLGMSDSKWYREAAAPIETYLDRKAREMVRSLGSKRFYLDMFQWSADATTESNEHVLQYMHNRLRFLDATTMVVIGCDRWESRSYRLACKALVTDVKSTVCIRLDPSTMEDADDPQYVRELVVEICTALQLDPNQCLLLLDFGDTSNLTIELIMRRAERMLKEFKSVHFHRFAIAGCSIPISINQAVSSVDSQRLLQRKEMIVWQELRKRFPRIQLSFSDYGVRGPTSIDGVRSLNTNGKIRYATSMSVLILRGHSVKNDGNWSQMQTLAESLVNSSAYCGAEYSWGDEQILACSKGKFTGNASKWIAFDTNHHLVWVRSEIDEFERSLVTLEYADASKE